MERLRVFVDEYGDPNLDVERVGVSGAYIVAAVCVRESALDKVLAGVAAVRERYFQTGEMKSSSIGPNDGRRLQIVRDLARLEIFVIAFCANKKAIDKNSGLAFKKSFIKYFANALYKRIGLCGNDFYVVADEHGTRQFQAELRSYLEKRFARDLFSRSEFEFVNSKNNLLLQVADVYAGSLARLYDENKISPQHEVLREALRVRVSLTLWPAGREQSAIPEYEHSNENDERIRQFCLRRAEEYLGAAADAADDRGDRDEVARAIFLDSLLAHRSFDEVGAFLPTPVIKREIAARLGGPISDHRFRSRVVAKLRDAGVVISSCAKGYRLPTTVSDMREFASFANSQIPPMASRLSKARKGIREATLGGVDILDAPGLEQLRRIVETVEQDV